MVTADDRLGMSIPFGQAPVQMNAGSPQEAISRLEAKWREFVASSKEVSYPNFTINGVFQADAGFFSQDATSLANFGPIQDGADFRRARIAAKGAVVENVNYFFQMDFAFPGRPSFTDVWMEIIDLPVLGALRFGQWKQPFSLEVVTSFRYSTFMERSLLFIPFTPFRHIGIGFYNHSDDLSKTWAVSGFRAGQDQYGGSISNDGGWATAERFTWVPYYDEPADGRHFLHLGAGHYLSSPARGIHNFRTWPEFFIGENAPGEVGTSGFPVPGALDGTPLFVATGPLHINWFNVLGSELLWVNGPFSVQSEAMAALVDRLGAPNTTFWGFYVQTGYFLTGEHRPYDRQTGTIERVKPFENFFRVRGADGSLLRGRGAWELVGRLSYLTLDDKDVQGGTITNLTAGVNWYWNAYAKLTFNWIHAFTNHQGFGTSNTDMFGARAQMDF